MASRRSRNHVRVDPIKVTLSDRASANGTMQDFGIPAGIVTKFLASRRIEIEKTGLYSLLVFSMGITKENGARSSPSSSTSRI